MKPVNLVSIALAGVIALTACVDQPTGPDAPSLQPYFSASAGSSAEQQLVVFKKNGVPADFGGRVEALGGSVAVSLPQIGVAYVEGLDAAGIASLGKDKGISAVEPAGVLQLIEPATMAAPLTGNELASPGAPNTAAYYSFQWNMRQIGADQAWAAGELGSSAVTVAIIDTGLDYTTPDLAGLVDLGRSRSFLPEEDALVEAYFPGYHPVTDLHYHGTHVGATVASNAVIAAGVTSQVTLMGLKVCRSGLTGQTGCPTSATFAALVFAADHGADVVNMSLGGLFTKRDNPGYSSVINRVFTYLQQKNVTVVVAAGNSNTDLDHHLYPEVDGNGDETGEITHYPSLYATYCDSPHVICVSATGPTSSAGNAGPWQDIDARAGYSNFGRSAIGVAAPGGNSGGSVWAACPTTSILLPMFGFPAGYCERFPLGLGGTSMASPHVAGVAALMVQKHGKNPSRVTNAIKTSADDLGQRGTDPFYGKGRINVARAVGVN